MLMSDDTNLLVFENTDVSLADEYAQINDWAVKMGKDKPWKTEGLMFGRLHPTKWRVPPSVKGIEQVQTAN